MPLFTARAQHFDNSSPPKKSRFYQKLQSNTKVMIKPNNNPLMSRDFLTIITVKGKIQFKMKLMYNLEYLFTF